MAEIILEKPIVLIGFFLGGALILIGVVLLFRQKKWLSGLNIKKFKFNNLKPNESRKFMVVGTVNNVGKSTCVVNYTSVKSGDLKADDNSRFCLEKSVCVEGPVSGQPSNPTNKGGFPVMPAPLGLTQTPATGPSALPLLSLLPLGLAGFYIRKKV